MGKMENDLWIFVVTLALVICAVFLSETDFKNELISIFVLYTFVLIVLFLCFSWGDKNGNN